MKGTGRGPESVWWHDAERQVDGTGLAAALADLHHAFTVRRGKDGTFLLGGAGAIADAAAEGNGRGRVAFVPAVGLRDLGDPSFRHDHGVEYAYVAGAMANGIASVELVEEMARAGMLAFFGSAGLSLGAIDAAIGRLQERVPAQPHGFNLIHTPAEPHVEATVVDLYLRRGVRLVEASAYLDLTLPLVRYRVHGIRRDANGRIVTPQRIVAKASRIEVAAKFFAPPPEAMLRELVARGELTSEEARLARTIPVAQDLTAEADSGGHTDNRPAVSLIPTFVALRARQAREYGFAQRLRVGAAGGIATPEATAAVFAMGAAYVLTGSINQACLEAGTSDLVRQMLAEAAQADITMAPAPDMFEMGVKVQVLKRGTLFAMRAAKLYELYRAYPSLEELPPRERDSLERLVFRKPLARVWQETREYFLERDRSQVERAESDPRHRMALVFRSYLGLASRWANSGVADRKIDYQIWCGPAMAAFNEWVAGSFLERPEERRVVTLAFNLLHGAAVLSRLHTLRLQGVELPEGLERVAPLGLSELENRLNRARAIV